MRRSASCVLYVCTSLENSVNDLAVFGASSATVTVHVMRKRRSAHVDTRMSNPKTLNCFYGDSQKIIFNAWSTILSLVISKHIWYQRLSVVLYGLLARNRLLFTIYRRSLLHLSDSLVVSVLSSYQSKQHMDRMVSAPGFRHTTHKPLMKYITVAIRHALPSNVFASFLPCQKGFESSFLKPDARPELPNWQHPFTLHPIRPAPKQTALKSFRVQITEGNNLRVLKHTSRNSRRSAKVVTILPLQFPITC